MSVKIGMRDY